jgi:hypothetical protein
LTAGRKSIYRKIWMTGTISEWWWEAFCETYPCFLRSQTTNENLVKILRNKCNMLRQNFFMVSKSWWRIFIVETYSLLIDTYVKDEGKKRLSNALEVFPY